jgi:hypothetical protein
MSPPRAGSSGTYITMSMTTLPTFTRRLMP